MNYIATLFMGVLFTNWLRDGSVPQTVAVSDGTRLTRLLEKCTRSYGQKKTYKLSADTSFGKVIFTIIHFDKPHK